MAQAALFTGTVFAGAVLLFWIQPLFTKMAVPLLGGSPSVWNTALVFFQATLLVGYAYAHALARWVRVRGQILVHALLLCAAAWVLPVAVGQEWVPPSTTPPVAWLMALLAVSVGPPFLAIAATAPLLQRWFSLGPHPRAHDPYFLYAASNAGSVAVLLAFPLVLEPLMATGTQSMVWAAGFVVLAAGIVTCGVSVARPGPGIAAAVPPSPLPSAPATRTRISWRRRVMWLSYSAVPSALLLGVTAHVSADIASAPLLWVVPLALYLLSFVNAFARKPLIPSWLAARAMAFGLVTLAAVFPWREPVGVSLPLHLAVFFSVALACHAELARLRPHPEALTEFYLYLSLGGLLGGTLVALVAPLAFDSVLEYPLVLGCAALLLPSRDRDEGRDERRRAESRWRLRHVDLALAAAIFASTIGVLPALDALDIPLPRIAFVCLLAVAAVLTLSRQVRPAAFGLCVAALLMGGVHLGASHDGAIWAGRSFFGVYRVTEQADPPMRSLMHGTTNHGGQWMPAQDDVRPSTYHTSSSPAVQVIERLRSRARAPLRVGVVGLGTGALAYWRQPGEWWRYYEIDPLVVWLATESGYFPMLERHDPDARIVLGDARLSLDREPDENFDVLLLDAFTAEAIPTHLLTREALALYVRKLRPGGVVLLHISNRILDLQPVVAGAAANLGLAGWSGKRLEVADRNPTAFGSHWVAVARDEAVWSVEELGAGWERLPEAGMREWRDEFSSLIGVVRWTGW